MMVIFFSSTESQCIWKFFFGLFSGLPIMYLCLYLSISSQLFFFLSVKCIRKRKLIRFICVCEDRKQKKKKQPKSFSPKNITKVSSLFRISTLNSNSEKPRRNLIFILKYYILSTVLFTRQRQRATNLSNGNIF